MENNLSTKTDNYSSLPCGKDHEEITDGRTYFYLAMRDYIRELEKTRSKETIDMKED